jgi:hypothetical protein
MNAPARLTPLIVLAAAAVLGPKASAELGPNGMPNPNYSQCFALNPWQDWRPGADGKSIYMRNVRGEAFKLAMTNPCNMLKDPAAQLVNETQDKKYVCGPDDLNIGFFSPAVGSASCPVASIDALSPDQVSKLPATERP